MKTRTFSVGLFGFFVLLSCLREPPKLPEETQEGLGTFGCLINGELVLRDRDRLVWTGKGGYMRSGVIGKQDTLGRFVLVARTEFGHIFHFFISHPQIGQNVIDSVFFWHENGNHMYIARSVPYIYFTRFDHVASGTFEFDAERYNRHTHERIPGKKIEVRRGRFDTWLQRTSQ